MFGDNFSLIIYCHLKHSEEHTEKIRNGNHWITVMQLIIAQDVFFEVQQNGTERKGLQTHFFNLTAY